MCPIHVFVATRDGQSERIAQRIARQLSRHGLDPALTILTVGASHERPSNSTFAVVVAAVRYGRHLPEAETFLSQFNKKRSPPPLALISVNLTARTPGRQSANDNPYLRKIIARYELEPIVAAAVAGRLDYQRYRWIDRQMIRLIMAMTGGPTDGVSTIEFTSWAQVDSVADEIARLFEPVPRS